MAAFGTDRIARVDTNGNVRARIEMGSASGAAVDPRTKRGPRGLALNAPARRLYVLNRIANTLSVIDTMAETVLREISVGSFDPTPAFIREGRGFLYDAKLSGNGTMACASCHVDAEMDMLAWDLGDPLGKMEPVTVTTSGGAMYSATRHPMKGPMVTQTFRGLKGLDPLHWRGDRASFLAFNGAFATLLGGTVMTNADMTAFRNFINSVVFQPNPNQKLDRTLPSEFGGGNPITGRTNFQSFVFDAAQASTCVQCHNQNSVPQPPVGAGTQRQIIADARLSEPQHVKVPHLRNLYQKIGFTKTPGAASITGFGFSHDGRDATLFDLFAAPRFGVLTNDTPTANLIKSNMVALLLCFDTGTAPAVGYGRTLTRTTLLDADALNDWNLLEQQASQAFRDPFYRSGVVTNISLIANGTIDGQRRALLYQPATDNYLTDRSDTGPFTRSELTARIAAGDTLTLMGVPIVSGVRMSLDRDWNSVRDGDEPLPPLAAMRSAAGILISWPTNTVGVVVEFSETLSPPNWRTETSDQSVNADRITVAIPIASQGRFFRLRGL